jgi:hypothetical protein
MVLQLVILCWGREVESLDGDQVTLNGKITVLGYTGSDIVTNRGNLLIEQKVYQRYHTTKDFYNL